MVKDQDFLDQQSELFAGQENTTNSGLPSGKTCQGRSQQTPVEILLPWLGKCLGQTLAFRPMDGKTPALLSEGKGSRNGACWTRNGSEFRKGAGVSSLSQILETGEIEARYFLSARACAGILRRAERRGKELPPMLRQALHQVVHLSPAPETQG